MASYIQVGCFSCQQGGPKVGGRNGPQKGKVVGPGLHGKGKIFELLFSRFPTLAIKQCIGHKSQCWKPRCYPRLLSKLQLRKPEINV